MDDIEKISPVFKGDQGHKLASRLLRWTGIDQLARRYGRYEEESGPAFVESFLADLGVDYQVGGIGNLQQLVEGPFITVSNHPYGGLDGLILIDFMGHFRDDFKVMANQFLSVVKTLKDSFISVIPNTDDPARFTKTNIAGVRKAMTQVMEGHPLGLFPAGAVSDLHLNGIFDREWQSSAIRLIQKMKVPVLPVRFFDRNSGFFYFLGLMNWKLRTLRLPKEVLNKSGKQVRLGIGPVITVEQQMECDSDIMLGKLLRDSVYDMKPPKNLMKRSDLYFDF